MKKIEILDCNTPAFITFDIAYFINDEDVVKIKDYVYHLKEFPAKLYNRKLVSFNKPIRQKASNGFDCETKFLIKNALAEFIWVSDGERYYRCYKLTCDLSYFSDFKQRFCDDVDVWGNRVIGQKDNHMHSHVYHVQRIFDNKDEFLKDMEAGKTPRKFKLFLEDILGDAG